MTWQDDLRRRRYWERQPLRRIARAVVLRQRLPTQAAVARALGLRADVTAAHLAAATTLCDPEWVPAPPNERAWWLALCASYAAVLAEERAALSAPCPCCGGTGLVPAADPMPAEAPHAG